MSESVYTSSPQKTGRSEKSTGKGSKSPNKKGKTKSKKKKSVEDLEVVDLFPEMENVEKTCKKRLIYTQKYGTPLYALNTKPFFRYMPSRAIM